MTTFQNLSLIPELERALDSLSYEIPTAIQARAIPALLEGRDVLGCAQTGTGKTAAFALPILQKLAAAPGRRSIRALVLTPTRELAAQVAESFASYGRFVACRHLVIYGGVSERPQIAALRRGADVLIATPGRLLDLMDRGHVDLGGVEFFVLDEADRMLDMGFIRDVRRVVAELPRRRQNLLFSATMPREIVALAGSILRDPISIEVAPRPTAELLIEQQVMFVDRPDKRRLLLEVLRGGQVDRAIVFTRTKHGANRLTKQLDRAGVRAAAIHGNKSQGARRRALDDFRAGDTSVLVATDVASRGIDIDDVTHVINFDLPNEPESYVHRIGRTGRAGRSGTAISFCDGTEGDYLRAIEKTIGRSIPVIDDHGYHFAGAVPRRAPRAEQKRRPPARRGRGSKPGARRPAPRAARSRR